MSNRKKSQKSELRKYFDIDDDLFCAGIGDHSNESIATKKYIEKIIKEALRNNKAAERGKILPVPNNNKKPIKKVRK